MTVDFMRLGVVFSSTAVFGLMSIAILLVYFFLKIKMKRDKLNFFAEEGRSEDEVEKLRIVLAFYERLPSEAMKEELLSLMEGEPFMTHDEFNLRLDTFVSRVKAAPPQENTFFAYAGSERLH